MSVWIQTKLKVPDLVRTKWLFQTGFSFGNFKEVSGFNWKQWNVRWNFSPFVNAADLFLCRVRPRRTGEVKAGVCSFLQSYLVVSRETCSFCNTSTHVCRLLVEHRRMGLQSWSHFAACSESGRSHSWPPPLCLLFICHRLGRRMLMENWQAAPTMPQRRFTVQSCNKRKQLHVLVLAALMQPLSGEWKHSPSRPRLITGLAAAACIPQPLKAISTKLRVRWKRNDSVWCLHICRNMPQIPDMFNGVGGFSLCLVSSSGSIAFHPSACHPSMPVYSPQKPMQGENLQRDWLCCHLSR